MCSTTEPTTLLDNLSKIASIVIALFSLIFSVYIFYTQNEKTDESENKSRELNSLKSIILEHNLNWLFVFFDRALEITLVLNEKELTPDEKEDINETLQDELKILRLKFIDLLLAVDEELYKKTMNSFDELLDELTESMFDEGINLRHKPKFEGLIVSSITHCKTEVVKTLYNFGK